MVLTLFLEIPPRSSEIPQSSVSASGINLYVVEHSTDLFLVILVPNLH